MKELRRIISGSFKKEGEGDGERGLERRELEVELQDRGDGGMGQHEEEAIKDEVKEEEDVIEDREKDQINDEGNEKGKEEIKN